MQCDICKGEIYPLTDTKGRVVWDQGNNAWPLGSHDDARCCDECNIKVVNKRLEMVTNAGVKNA